VFGAKQQRSSQGITRLVSAKAKQAISLGRGQASSAVPEISRDQVFRQSLLRA